MSEHLFQNNLEIWAKTFPKQAFMLPYVDCIQLEFCTSEKGELNLKGPSFFYHDNQGVVEEANEWFKKLDLGDVPALFVFGVGLGYYYNAVKTWLREDKKRRLVFLENDLAVIHRLFETKLGAEILQDSQVQLIYFRDLNDDEASFEILYWNFAMSRLNVSALHSYAAEHQILYEDLKHKIAYDAAVKNALVDEYLRYGGAFFINFYQNMLCMADSYLGNRFFGKFPKVPAIICGAGPSLEKNLPLLGKLLDRAVVFAGGSALNVLNAANFQPHFGAGIDPNPMQYARMSTNQGFEVPFFYRNRMFHNAFKKIHGPRLYITGCGGYDIAEYFEEKFGIKSGFLDEGHNVVNFSVEVAYAMGCDPIIFVGMDLAFTGMEAYAPGVVEKTTVSESELLDNEDYDSRALLRKDIFGNPLYTLWKWIAEAQWIGDYAKSHPLVTLINCTEGGLGFPGVQNRTLEEVAKEKLTRTYELNNRIHGETQNSALPKVTFRKIMKAMRELSVSLKRTEENLNILMQDAQNSFEKMEAGTIQKPAQSGLAALAETELEEEPGYKHVCEIFNAVLTRLLSGELHEINTGNQTEKQKALSRLSLNIKRLKFLKEVAQINQELIEHAIKERKKAKVKKPSVPLIPEPIPGIYKVENGQLIISDPELDIELSSTFDATPQRTFYLDNTLKSEVFYRAGLLHGPAAFWDPKGKMLARSWYVDGKQQGKSYWYYPSGGLYSLQRFKDGVWDGRQEYYYADGSPKTLMEYKQGVLQASPLLF